MSITLTNGEGPQSIGITQQESGQSVAVSQADGAQALDVTQAEDVQTVEVSQPKQAQELSVEQAEGEQEIPVSPEVKFLRGADGATFVPHMDKEGNLSWTNDGGYENPQPVNLTGPKGDSYVLTDEDREEIAGMVPVPEIPDFTEADPTVPDWAKRPEKPTYTAEEVGALPDSTAIPEVPTKVSAFENDAGYLTELPEHEHSQYLTELPEHSHSQYLTELPTHEHTQYLTEHQDISGKVDRSALLGLLYPVGSIYTTSANSAPSIGGTWELVGKEFITASGSGTTTLITYNETNTTSCTVYYCRSGNNMRLKFALKTAVATAETNLTFGTLVLSKLGVDATGSVNYTSIPFGGENGIVLCTLSTAGKLTSTDVVVKGSTTSVAAESTVYGEVALVLRPEDMLDSACDKFHWKRTA